MVGAAAAHSQGLAFALGSALMFGLVNVAVKASALHPLTKAGAAYLVAGVALAVTLRGLRIARADLPKILLTSVAGGALAPLLLFYGLESTTAVAASLLLTLEMVFTAVLAAAFLRERVRGPAAFGLALLFAAAIAAGVASVGDAGEGAAAASLAGPLLVVAAALCWGVDNTVSARLTGTYRPHHLIAVKGVIGGALVLALLPLTRTPLHVPASEIKYVLFIGLLGVSASTVLFYHALQRIGATRTSALFLPATALAGALGGWALLDERLAWAHLTAGALVVAGAWLMAKTPRHQKGPA